MYLIKKCGYELTMARSLFRDKKRSGCLMHLKASMSLDRKRGCSKTSVMWAECSFWNSLMEEFQEMAASSTSSQGETKCVAEGARPH